MLGSKKMRISFSKVLDVAATAVLLYTVATQVYGASRGSARYASLAVAALCILFCVAIWRGDIRVKRWIGTFLVIMSIGVCLAVWRFRVPLAVGLALPSAYFIVGVLMIRANRIDRAQPGNCPLLS